MAINKYPEWSADEWHKVYNAVNTTQIGGKHYKKYGDLQPWDVVTAWNLGYLDGTALKYIARWKDKGGVTDLQKAIHFLQKQIEVIQNEQNGKASGAVLKQGNVPTPNDVGQQRELR